MAQRLPESEVAARRATLAERTLEFLRQDVDQWENHDRIDSGAAADARSSILAALAALAGDRDDEL